MVWWSPAVLPAWLAQVEPLEGGREKEDGGDWRLARRRIVWLPACASAGTSTSAQRQRSARARPRHPLLRLRLRACMHGHGRRGRLCVLRLARPRHATTGYGTGTGSRDGQRKRARPVNISSERRGRPQKRCGEGGSSQESLAGGRPAGRARACDSVARILSPTRTFSSSPTTVDRCEREAGQRQVGRALSYAFVLQPYSVPPSTAGRISRFLLRSCPWVKKTCYN